MSTLTDHVAALRRNRARYVQSIENLDAKLAAEKAKPPTSDAEEPLRISRVEEYVTREKAILVAAIASIDDDLSLVK